MRRLPVLLVFGTRPEAVKMAPVVAALESSETLAPVVCVTAQHRDMLDQMLDVFGITPDHDLDLMRPNQTLDGLTARALLGVGEVIRTSRPAAVLVHGDTTTTFAGALAGFYAGVPVGHVEAGLRSFDMTRPYPEEMNRVLADRLCRFYFAPTDWARTNLLAEGVPEQYVTVTGNTCVDAVRMALPQARDARIEGFSWSPNGADGRRIVLVTAHRRESFGDAFRDMCRAMRDIAERFDDVEVVYPVHLNPNVQRPVRELLDGHPRIHLLEPQPYLPFLRLMNSASVILTDSGGVQEEAPGLGKPVLVMREVTERPEGVDAGVARLVGTSRERIVDAVSELLTDQRVYREMVSRASPYGDGYAGKRIVEYLERELSPPPGTPAS